MDHGIEAVVQFGRGVARLRRTLGVTQRVLAGMVGVSQSYISLVENGRLRHVTIEGAARLSAALGAGLRLTLESPVLIADPRQRDAAHALAVAHIARRLEKAGWFVMTEVEIGSARSRGWIDLLAFDPRTGTLLLIEVKTIVDDLGGIERQVGWYEREALAAARRLGWRARRVVAAVLLLETAENDERVRVNRDGFARAFPMRAEALGDLVAGSQAPERAGRFLAMVDPRSHRRAWLRPTTIDGRRSPAPYDDYADFMRMVRRRSPGSPRSPRSPRPVPN